MGLIREAVEKHFLKNNVVDFLETKQFASAQLQWAYFLSLYPLHLDADGKEPRLLCLESIAALAGQAHRQRFHRGTTKIQGCLV